MRLARHEQTEQATGVGAPAPAATPWRRARAASALSASARLLSAPLRLRLPPAHLSEVHGAQRLIHAVCLLPTVVALLAAVACAHAGAWQAGWMSGGGLLRGCTAHASLPWSRRASLRGLGVHPGARVPHPTPPTAVVEDQRVAGLHVHGEPADALEHVACAAAVGGGAVRQGCRAGLQGRVAGQGCRAGLQGSGGAVRAGSAAGRWLLDAHRLGRQCSWGGRQASGVQQGAAWGRSAARAPLVGRRSGSGQSSVMSRMFSCLNPNLGVGGVAGGAGGWVVRGSGPHVGSDQQRHATTEICSTRPPHTPVHTAGAAGTAHLVFSRYSMHLASLMQPLSAALEPLQAGRQVGG